MDKNKGSISGAVLNVSSVHKIYFETADKVIVPGIYECVFFCPLLIVNSSPN